MRDYILLITLHADPAMPPGYDEWGGTHSYMKELLDIFGEKNVPCLLITRKSMRFLPSQEQYNHCCKIIRFSNGNDEPMSKLELYRYHNENLEKIEEVIKEQEGLPHIIHSVYWNSGRLAMELSSKLKIPYVHSVISNSRGRVKRGAQEPLTIRADYEQQIYKNASWILCVSDDEKNDLIQFYGINEKKIIVCGQFIAHSFANPAHDINGFPRLNTSLTDKEQKDIAENYNKTFQYNGCKDHFWLHKAFTYLGRMDVNKGVIPILRAWYLLLQRYQEKCPPLWMVGGSIPEIDHMRQMAKEYIMDLDVLEKNNRLIWWGYLNPEGMSTILLKTQVIITHSLYEPGGRVAVEAMMESVPVIATPNGFAKDIIRNWENGFLVEYGDIQKLAARMEHFIHQPLLGNSLGLNAHESAKEIEQNWGFAENHLFAYNLTDRPKVKQNKKEQDYYAHRMVNLFPYIPHRLTHKYICQFFQANCNETVLKISDIDTGICTSDMKLLYTEQSEYIVKHVFARLATSPLFNPFLYKQIIRDAQEHFDIEVNIYRRLKSKVFVCADPFQHLIYLRKLAPMDVTNKSYLEYCISYLARRPNIITEDEKLRYLHIMEALDDFFEIIEKTLYALKKELPEFYFECSGMFSNRLSWTIAPYVLTHNKHALEQDDYEQLKNLCDFFHTDSYHSDPDSLRDINLDIQCRHLMLDSTQIQLIDHEKASIGIVEMDIASFLYDFYKNTAGICITTFRENVKPYFINNDLQEKEIWFAFAYRAFYDIIVDSVMKCRRQDEGLRLLEEIQSLVENL